MKKTIAMLSVLLFLFATVVSCNQAKDKSEQTETETSESADTTSNEMMAKVQYTCTMHPEVVKDEPGKCPKCGMDLVKKDGDAHDSTEHQH